MRKLIQAVLVFSLTFAVCGFGLAAVYDHSSGVIAEREARAVKEALSRVLPGASRFQAMDPAKLAGESKRTKGVWVGTDGEGKTVGWAVLSQAPGYGDVLKILVGIGPDGRTTGVEVMYAAGETKDVGTKVTEPAFLEQFRGLKAPVELAAGRKAEPGEIQAISGATISSQGVLDGVNQAGKTVARLREKR